MHALLLLDDMQLLNAPFKILAHALVFHLVRCEALALLLRALPACESGGKSDFGGCRRHAWLRSFQSITWRTSHAQRQNACAPERDEGTHGHGSWSDNSVCSTLPTACALLICVERTGLQGEGHGTKRVRAPGPAQPLPAKTPRRHAFSDTHASGTGQTCRSRMSFSNSGSSRSAPPRRHRRGADCRGPGGWGAPPLHGRAAASTIATTLTSTHACRRARFPAGTAPLRRAAASSHPALPRWAPP